MYMLQSTLVGYLYLFVIDILHQWFPYFSKFSDRGFFSEILKRLRPLLRILFQTSSQDQKKNFSPSDYSRRGPKQIKRRPSFGLQSSS